MSDQYLRGILAREAVPNGPGSRGFQILAGVSDLIRPWAANYLLGTFASGSFAKGTANLSATDLDVFVSLSPDTPNTLKEIYTRLATFLENAGYPVRRQNVSIGTLYRGAMVDIVPAKRQAMLGTDHSIYRRKADTWTQTNINRHIAYVANSHRIEEIRILKLWRNQHGLDFPSFCLELFAIDYLTNQYRGQLADNVVRVLREFASPGFANARVVDPANTNNMVSDELTAADRMLITAAAKRALAGDWNQAVK